MTTLRRLFDRIPFFLLALLCLTLGLAPFTPEPHLWEKLKMLADGTLMDPVDIFDMAFHGFPWMLLILKAVLSRPTTPR